MSAKSRFKGTKVDLDTKEPRALDEIHKEYANATSQAGQLQYQIAVYSDDLKRINDSLRSLNYEAAARQAADKKEVTNADQS